MSVGMVGRELGNYVLKTQIGEGGMGAVFAGEHRFLGTRVAVKVLHGSFASNPGVTQRFFQEAKSSIEIGHPGIIKILDFGQTDGGELYLVMELLEGGSLTHTVEVNGAYGEGAAARLGVAIADGLAAAHAKGIVHRDLKPDNVFITSQGEVKVLDFGIAKVASSVSGTKTGSLLGTPQYMAPEQCKGSKHVGPHTDVYALGAILYFMTTGRPPFVGEEVAELLAKHLFEAPVPPSTLAAISPEMDSLILQCLAKKPEERPADMGEVARRLTLRVGSAPGVSMAPQLRAPTATAAAVGTVGAMSTISGSAGEISSPLDVDPVAPRRRPPLWAIGVSSALAIGLMVVLATRGPSTPKPVASATPTPPPSAPVRAAAPPPAAAAAVPTAPKAVQVVLRSDPAGARIEIDGQERGTTPAVLNLALPQEVWLRLDGYQPAKEVLTTSGVATVQLTAEKRAAPARPARAKHPTPSAAGSPRQTGGGLD